MANNVKSQWRRVPGGSSSLLSSISLSLPRMPIHMFSFLHHPTMNVYVDWYWLLAGRYLKLTRTMKFHDPRCNNIRTYTFDLIWFSMFYIHNHLENTRTSTSRCNVLDGFSILRSNTCTTKWNTWFCFVLWKMVDVMKDSDGVRIFRSEVEI